MWIGIECGAEAADLLVWAAQVERAGLGNARAQGVAEFLRKAANLVAGAAPGCGVNGPDRLREVEGRAAAAVERARADAARRAAAIVGKALGKGVDTAAVMRAAGVDGWRDGAAAGMGHGGEANKRRARGHVRGGGMAEGGEVTAERGKPPVTPEITAARDARYAATWEAWAAVELEKRGFKVRHVARGVDLDVTECWRHISGWKRHWRREGLKGRLPPDAVPEEWRTRFERAEFLAKGLDHRGAPVVLNGGKGGMSAGEVG